MSKLFEYLDLALNAFGSTCFPVFDLLKPFLLSPHIRLQWVMQFCVLMFLFRLQGVFMRHYKD
jgi:hypothetical protein